MKKTPSPHGESHVVEFKLWLSSPPDRERLVADVMTEDGQLAEISYETDTVMLEVYPRSDGQPWQLDCDQALAALAEARAWLLARLGGPPD